MDLTTTLKLKAEHDPVHHAKPTLSFLAAFDKICEGFWERLRHKRTMATGSQALISPRRAPSHLLIPHRRYQGGPRNRTALGSERALLYP
ncbi:Hypothetical predicted protein [Pelobates cultripes]|uniref:Uncharacterized protein n=1 Tax=Pelobates cultripes TaxID=61616 RepID=A0AAD1RNS2_PELCU|nr:Hypothetical predicted protein [Pelobates cultripes]